MKRLDNLLVVYERMGYGIEKKLCADRIEKVAATTEQKVEVWVSTKENEWLHSWSSDKLLCNCKEFNDFIVLFCQLGGDFNYRNWVLQNAIRVHEELEELYWMWSVAELGMSIMESIEESLIDMIEFSGGLEFFVTKIKPHVCERFDCIQKSDELYVVLSKEPNEKLASLGKRGLEHLNEQKGGEIGD